MEPTQERQKTFDDQHVIKRYEEYTRSNEKRYIAQIRHNGLGTFKLIKDINTYILSSKIEAQFRIWDDRWAKIMSKSQKESDREVSLISASEKTAEAQKDQKEIEDLLIHTLEVDDTIDWETLKDKSKFEEPNPKNELDDNLEKLKASFSNLDRFPRFPDKSYFEPEFNLLDRIFP